MAHLTKNTGLETQEQKLPDSRVNFDTDDKIGAVEKVIFKSSNYPTKNKLKNTLSGNISDSELDQILKQLVKSNKIMIAKDGAIVWTAVNSQKSKEFLEECRNYPL